MIKVTADTNIYISGLAFKGKPYQFLELARKGGFDLAISQPILDEIHRVLRTKFQWPPEMLDEVEPRLAAFTQRVKPRQAIDVVKEDPSDNRILECAVEAGSDVVVTGDKDLLRLGSYEGIQIMKVGDFLSRGRSLKL